MTRITGVAPFILAKILAVAIVLHVIIVVLPFAHDVLRVGESSRIGVPSCASREQSEIRVAHFEDGWSLVFIALQNLRFGGSWREIVVAHQRHQHVGVHIGGAEMIGTPVRIHKDGLVA